MAALLTLGVAGASTLIGLYAGILSDLPKLDIPIDGGRSAPIRIYDSGRPPTLLAELAGPVIAEPVPAQEMPETLRVALIAAKDAAFPSRGTMSITSLARILGAEIWGGSGQSASSVTLGFIHENYVAGRTHPRPRLYETALAYQLERSWSKERILTSYLNTLYLGEGCYGVAAAAQRYFGVRPAALTTAQAAMLVGLAVSTGAPAPRTNPDAALEARNYVLNRMFQEGYLDGRTLQMALAEPVELNPAPAAPVSRSAAWTDFIEDQLVRRYGAARVLRGGLTVTTTLDLPMQESAEAALADALSDAPHTAQGVLVAVDLASGAVVAMAQTSPEEKAGAFSAPHETGPLLRPLIVAAALERGISPLTVYALDAGPMIFWQGAALADESIFARVAQQLGPEATLDTAALLGLTFAPGHLAGGADLASTRISPMQAATLFTAFAAEGRVPASNLTPSASADIGPHTILQVETPDGSLADHAAITWRDALSADTAFLITSMLASSSHSPALPTDVFPAGSVALLAAPAPDEPGAWFVGYSSRMLTVVWIGDQAAEGMADSSEAPASALAAAEHALTAFMGRTAELMPPQVLTPPPDGEWRLVNVCSATGEMASPGCPATVQLLVPLVLAPAETCALHTRSATTTSTTGATTTTDTQRDDVVSVPSVVGLTPSEAEARLASTGLLLTCTIGAPGSHPGLIASQSPSPGATLKRGQTVAAVVEALPPSSTVTAPGGTSTTISP